jgi:hypothetical protein
VSKAPLGPAGTITVAVAGVDGIPAAATSVSINLTAVGASAPTFLTAYPAGTVRPNSSTLNVASAAAQANFATVQLGTGGAITIFNSGGNVNILADIAGYFAPTGLLAWAYVNANGTIAQSSGNVTVANPAAGSYCIGVTGGTVHVAVASLDSLENTGGTVQAGVFDASGCPANAANIDVITRPQSQDGGVPGVNHAFYIMVS